MMLDKIKVLYVFLAQHPDGSEGIVAPDGQPCITYDPAQIPLMKDSIRYMHARVGGALPIRIVKFERLAVVEIMDPKQLEPDDRFYWEDQDGTRSSSYCGRLDLCRGCGESILPENRSSADGCPCNSPRGINHGFVPRNTCTCLECDPAQTGASRVRH